MATQHTSDVIGCGDEGVSFPMTRSTWKSVSTALKLSPQQVRIVELMLQGKQDKEIAANLGISIYTVQTYNKRIFARLHVSDRLALILLIFSIAQEHVAQDVCSCQQ